MPLKKKKIPLNGKKQYLISLNHSRSVIALVVSALVMNLTFMAFVMGLQTFGEEMESIFHYFTVLSNLFSATGAAFMLPYAVEGIHHKRFVLPRWILLFQYCGAVGLSITMTASLLIILPTTGKNAVTGMNFWMHIVIPLLAVVLFELVETSVIFTWRETAIALIPFWTYMTIYYIMVVIVGKENGGWEDIYRTTYYWPAWISALLMLAVGMGQAVLLRWIHNRRARQSIARMTRLWQADMDPVELKVEAFGLGRYMASQANEVFVTLPIDIFAIISKRFGIPMYDLARAYIRGVCDSYSELPEEQKKRTVG